MSRRFREFDKVLLDQGFKVDFVDDETVIYTKEINVLKLDVQLWEDGHHRVTHSLNDCSNTYPSHFTTVEGMGRAIYYETNRRKIDGDINEYHAFDEGAKAHVSKFNITYHTTDRTLCKWCGKYKAPSNLKECSRCWELRTRIYGDVLITLRILNSIVVAALEQGAYEEELTRLKDKLDYIADRCEGIKESKDTV